MRPISSEHFPPPVQGGWRGCGRYLLLSLCLSIERGLEEWEYILFLGSSLLRIVQSEESVAILTGHLHPFILPIGSCGRIIGGRRRWLADRIRGGRGRGRGGRFLRCGRGRRRRGDVEGIRKNVKFGFGNGTSSTELGGRTRSANRGGKGSGGEGGGLLLVGGVPGLGWTVDNCNENEKSEFDQLLGEGRIAIPVPEE